MDWRTRIRHLAEADQRIAAGEQRIESQGIHIAALQRQGKDSNQAQALLAAMRDMQSLREAHRELVLRELMRFAVRNKPAGQTDAAAPR